MRIVVCVRIGRDGELGPFDAAAYETALRQGGEVILLSMCPESDKDALLKLTRLGASRAVLLSDKAFVGADTLATAYALSLAVRKLSPDLVFCGRQTMIGDTAQTGVMLATLAGLNPVTGVMKIESVADTVTCTTREEGRVEVQLPALLTVERINDLRLPRLRSRLGEIEVWHAADIGADAARCGLSGSPTRVVKTFENESGKRKCKFITRAELEGVIATALNEKNEVAAKRENAKKLDTGTVISVTDAPLEMARQLSDTPRVIPLLSVEEIVKIIETEKPRAVIFGSDAESKRTSAALAATLSLGLCADCTALEYDGEKIYMYRPALSGSVIAKIKSLTSPTLATVRTQKGSTSEITVALGYGVRNSLEKAKAFAKDLGASVAATRKMTDNGITPYDLQVGLTGKTVAPPVYIAIGVSGAVHHIVGMERSGTVIAINPDKDAPIFDYADYGILEEF
jgi:electron transfer flavoprotein beta subunit